MLMGGDPKAILPRIMKKVCLVPLTWPEDPGQGARQ